MAEITDASSQKKTGDKKIRSKKQSTRIDMTPMVDLAFLLLTFFILTRTFHQPYVMEVTMPDKLNEGEPPPLVPDKNVLNLVLGENNKIFYWTGLTGPVQETDFSSDGVRKLLLEKYKANQKLVVLIKPKETSKYENVVDILDEMEITAMKRYAIVQYSDYDEQIVSGE